MKPTAALHVKWLTSFVLFICLIFTPSLYAADQTGIIVKIGRLEKTLNVVDELFSSPNAQPGTQPSTQLRAMLQGTDWIDADRQIVAELSWSSGQFQGHLLVPFWKPNEAFKAAYSGKSGPDYYLVALPPGTPITLSADRESRLTAISKEKAAAALTAYIPLNNLLVANEAKIKAQLDQIASAPQNKTTAAAPTTPQDLQDMLTGMVDAAKQVETLTVGLDLNKIKLTTLMEVKALTGSKLAGLLTRPDQTAFIHPISSGYQINFRTHAYDVMGLMGLIGDTFGEFYQKMGLDFKRMAEIGNYFTGEMSGGVSYGKDSVDFEMVAVLSEKGAQDQFVDKVYTPWLMQYSQDMQAMIEKQLGKKLAPLFNKTPASTIDGHNVTGVQGKVPFTHDAGADDPPRMMKYDMRTVTIGNLMFVAPTDARLKALIDGSESFKEKPATGPLMLADINMGEYLKGMLSLLGSGQTAAVPPLGKLVFQADIKEGSALTTSAVSTKDIKLIAANFLPLMMALSAQPAPPPASSMPANRAQANTDAKQQRTGAAANPVTVQAPPPETPYEKWYNKGALVAAYTNDKGAIRYLRKAIKLDDNRSEAHFQLGICYGQLGRYKESINELNRAIAIDPEKGVYYYGRARVYLLAGMNASAQSDFQQAAALENKDAKAYLEFISQR